MESKMTQIQSMISSLIIDVRKNWFHSLLAKCFLHKNLELFVAKRCVILLLLYINVKQESLAIAR